MNVWKTILEKISLKDWEIFWELDVSMSKLCPKLLGEWHYTKKRKLEGNNPIKLVLKHADDTTLMAESEEEMKSPLMKVKEESEKFGLKLNIQKTKILESSPFTLRQIDGETVETVADCIFSGLQNHCRWWLQPWN